MTDDCSASRPQDSHQPSGTGAAGVTAQLRAEHRYETTFLQRAVDTVTALVGLPGFAAALTIAIIFWTGSNIVARHFGLRAADPPPFVWLQGALTTGAFYVAILILTTQRREEKLSSQRGQLLLELAILNDQKSSKIIKMLQELRTDDPQLAERTDGEAQTMSTPLDYRSVMGAIKTA